MSIISLIIKREFIAKVRNKSFVVMTFLSPLLFVAIAGFIGYLSSMKAETKKIAIHDETGLFANDFVKQNKKEAAFKYLNLSEIDTKALKDSITNENFDGLIIIPKTNNLKDLESKIEFISNNSPSISFIEKTQDVIAEKITKINLETAKLRYFGHSKSTILSKSSFDKSFGRRKSKRIK